MHQQGGLTRCRWTLERRRGHPDDHVPTGEAVQDITGGDGTGDGVELVAALEEARRRGRIEIGAECNDQDIGVEWALVGDHPFRHWINAADGRLNELDTWPGHVDDAGGVRNQFAHVIDILPTILDVAGIAEPSVVNGIAQSPMDGTSLAYTFDPANADEPSRHLTQYFEMFGNYAIYHEGWMLVDKVTRPSWVTSGVPDATPSKAEWELYHVAEDWTQNRDVAADNPDKVKELEAIWWQEAERNNVLPLDASVVSRLVTPRPSATAGRTEFSFPGRMTGISNGVAPSILNASYTFTAEVTVPEGGGDGMIITQGGRFTGYGLYINKGKPTFTWNLLGLKVLSWEAPEVLTAGKHTVEFAFT